MGQKARPHSIFSIEIHFKCTDFNCLKVKCWRKTCHANTHQKKAKVILISERADFEARKVIRDKEVSFPKRHKNP